MPLDMFKGLVLVFAGINVFAVRHMLATGTAASRHTGYFVRRSHREARKIALMTFLVFLATVELLNFLGPPLPGYLKYPMRVHIAAAVLLAAVTILILAVHNGNKSRNSHGRWVWHRFVPIYAFMLVSGILLTVLR